MSFPKTSPDQSSYLVSVHFYVLLLFRARETVQLNLCSVVPNSNVGITFLSISDDFPLISPNCGEFDVVCLVHLFHCNLMTFWIFIFYLSFFNAIILTLLFCLCLFIFFFVWIFVCRRAG